MLETRNLGVGYGNLQVVHDVSLAIGQGEIVALVGGNGAGKTTTLRAIVGLLPPWQGEVLLDGQSIQNLKTPQIVSLGLAYVPEQKSVFPKMTVMENLELALNSKEAKQKKQETMAEVFDLFPRISSTTKLKQMAGTLSGGEQRMLVIARALMSRPLLILLDEPSLGLAPKLVQDLFEAIEKIHDRGVPILLVEQNVTLALQIADRAYVLEQGRIVLEGTGPELSEMPHIRERIWAFNVQVKELHTMDYTTLAAQLFLTGIFLSSLYILVTFGLTMIFGVMEIVNFAHASFAILGGYACLMAVSALGMNPFLALMPVVVFMALVGLFTFDFFARYTLDLGDSHVVIYYALLLIISNILALIYGLDYKFIPSICGLQPAADWSDKIPPHQGPRGFVEPGDCGGPELIFEIQRGGPEDPGGFAK